MKSCLLPMDVLKMSRRKLNKRDKTTSDVISPRLVHDQLHHGNVREVYATRTVISSTYTQVSLVCQHLAISP